MPMWRCPHCGTPQAETARCWVCRRSSTACGTCRNFRRSVAGSLGYCGLDRRREPLAGDEIRPCWEAWPAGTDPTPVAPPMTLRAAGGAPTSERAAALEFVEVGDRSAADPAGRTATPAAPNPEPSPIVAGPLPPPVEPGWSLWGDPDR
jgi:hypothetical protein